MEAALTEVGTRLERAPNCISLREFYFKQLRGGFQRILIKSLRRSNLCLGLLPRAMVGRKKKDGWRSSHAVGWWLPGALAGDWRDLTTGG